MKVNYALLKSKHYSSDRVSSNYMSGEDVYKEIGYNLADLKKQNPAYENTCAVRMSLALIKSGVNFTGRLKIKGGPYKGRRIELGAKLLADQLMKPNIFGKPEVYKPSEFIKNVAGRKGVVLFWKVTGYGGGHIDLIDASNSVAVCNSNCYFNSKEIWFWPLK
ncbi:T6SS effector amidase Tae4 family protein [Candidatus Thiosymbion oneisti]|uniref:T6SS effector amidase Tae4 family protein n=1 Tax=Candidatus Thiosymbion oneisti TaxID=589554 RepID=UPI000AB8CA35|nr:T6SS effector amidase Tae4 family protein [Candidatus Thiosymbion oneisti]